MTDLYITTIQTDLHWTDKDANRQMLSDKIAHIPSPKNVVILPEMFTTGFNMHPELYAEQMDEITVLWMSEMAKKHKIILTGSIIIEENGHYYNRMIWMQPNGQFATYDKRHLFGYAGENEKYTAGDNRVIVSVNGWKILLQICYDLRFPVWSRQQPVDNESAFEFDAIVYVANWPEKRNQAWNALLPARAIENQCFVIGVNRVGYDGNKFYHSGNTQIIDPLGRQLYEKSDIEDTFTAQLLRSQLEETRTRYPFAKDADKFKLLKQ